MMYSNDEIALIFLSQFDFITSKKFADICSYFESPEEILTCSDDEFFLLRDILKNNYKKVNEKRKQFNKEEFFQKLNKRGIFCLTLFSENYPEKLKKLEHPPYVLFCVGNIKLLNKKALAVVGARNPSVYGKLVTEKFVKEVAKNDIVIVSGLATGIDKFSHESALEVNGGTIAVMGGGFDHIFPAMNINLAREIAKKGLIVTEYYVDFAPTKYTFPVRNRIIAGLSDAILIPEARKDSGSLYTMEYGLEIGVDTMCVPGNINSELSYSTNDLIKKGTAQCVTTPEDVLMHFGITKNSKIKKEKKLEQYSMEESLIINCLKDGSKSVDYLQEKTGYSIQTLNISLTSLEIRGIIKRLAGNEYILCEII